MNFLLFVVISEKPPTSFISLPDSFRSVYPGHDFMDLDNHSGADLIQIAAEGIMKADHTTIIFHNPDKGGDFNPLHRLLSSIMRNKAKLKVILTSPIKPLEILLNRYRTTYTIRTPEEIIRDRQ